MNREQFAELHRKALAERETGVFEATLRLVMEVYDFGELDQDASDIDECAAQIGMLRSLTEIRNEILSLDWVKARQLIDTDALSCVGHDHPVEDDRPDCRG